MPWARAAWSAPYAPSSSACRPLIPQRSVSVICSAWGCSPGCESWFSVCIETLLYCWACENSSWCCSLPGGCLNGPRLGWELEKPISPDPCECLSPICSLHQRSSLYFSTQLFEPLGHAPATHLDHPQIHPTSSETLASLKVVSQQLQTPWDYEIVCYLEDFRLV